MSLRKFFGKFCASLVFLSSFFVSCCESKADSEFLHAWRSLDDVDAFCWFYQNNNNPVIDDNIVNATIEISEGLEGMNLLCILTKALYEVTPHFPIFEEKILETIKYIINSGTVSCKNVSLDTPEYSDVKWATLLFFSQTVGYKGRRLIAKYESYPILLAKEILETEGNNTYNVAQSILRRIESLIG